MLVFLVLAPHVLPDESSQPVTKILFTYLQKTCIDVHEQYIDVVT